MPAPTWRSAAVATVTALGLTLGLASVGPVAVASAATPQKARPVAAARTTVAVRPAVRPAAAARPAVRPAVRTVVRPRAAAPVAGTVAPVRATVSTRTAATVAAPAAAGPAFGAQFHGMWSSYTDAQREMVLTTMAANGVRNVRIDLSWAMLQPTGPDSYDAWGVGFADSVIDRAVAHGLTPHVTLWLTPAWANHGAGEHVLPTDVADYARVARFAAARWAGKVAAYEVWNEPNNPDFLVGAGAAGYARLVQAAYPAFHAGDPAVKVVLGGTSYVDVDWTTRVLAAGALHSFDVVGVNPYMGVSDAAPTTADDGTPWTMRHVAALHDAVVTAGRADAPLWFTEFGWSARTTPADAPNWSRGVSAATQAAYLVATLRMVRAEMPYVTQVFWYQDLVDIQPGFLGGYGLVNRDGSPTAALKAVRAA